MVCVSSVVVLPKTLRSQGKGMVEKCSQKSLISTPVSNIPVAVGGPACMFGCSLVAAWQWANDSCARRLWVMR